MFFFAIQNLVDIQSSRFWLYSQKANYKWRSYQADRPLVQTCVYFTESYYDKHTNTTEICPDYYIYSKTRIYRSPRDLSKYFDI